MAKAINHPMPIEVGYDVVSAIVMETGEKGEIWVPGCLSADDGNLEHQSEF
jgi:hypothetical protein